jgi:hypothetical protein
MFAPIPLTDERSPLAHAAAIARRRMAEKANGAAPRHRTRPPTELKLVEKKVIEIAPKIVSAH